MSKRTKCAVCGKPLLPGQYHMCWDPRQKRAVKVCRDDRTCYARYLVNPEKHGGNADGISQRPLPPAS